MLIRESVLPQSDVWLRVLDTSSRFTVSAVDEIPIKFPIRPNNVVEISEGYLWAYGGELYQLAGDSVEADFDFPGWNTFPDGSIFDLWK